MTAQRPLSLRHTLVVRLLGFQIGVLLLCASALFGYALIDRSGGSLIEPDFAQIAAGAISRGRDGRLRVVDTIEFRDARQRYPDFWFVARNAGGETISYNKAPAGHAAIAQNLDRISSAYVRDPAPPHDYVATISHEDGPAGEFTILGKARAGDWTANLTAAGGKLTVFGSGAVVNSVTILLLLSTTIMLPFLAVLALITVVATPMIVRRALRRLFIAAQQASGIDIDRRGTRLSVDGIPAEIVPLVDAMNGALRRLDEGYDRHQRFIADAAHELRTPIAILQAKIEAAPDSLFGQRLQRDVARLATLAEQMLDLQRLDQEALLEETIDLGAIVRESVADLAPLVIAGGGELEVVDLGSVPIRGDPAAVGRVFANLIQNAVEHGGRRVVVRVQGTVIEVEDDGPGIPEGELERVFEPFHRLRPRGTGAGLGLNLVRRVMARHGGSVEALEVQAGGTVIRLEFVAAARCHNQEAKTATTFQEYIGEGTT